MCAENIRLKRQSPNNVTRPVYSSVRERSPVPAALKATISQSSQSSKSSHEEYNPSTSKGQQPKQFSQEEFNDHCRDLNLSEQRQEVEGSRLAENGLLQRSVKTTLYRTKEKKIWASNFSKQNITLFVKARNAQVDPEIEQEEYDEDVDKALEEEITYECTYLNNLEALFSLFKTEHIPREWRLFLDGSSNSLKAVQQKRVALNTIGLC
uniref:CSON012354 protein n=1 Tax=Culicoides sonorensis TaxID=179676 RepID=A0A336M945_CULSO